LLLESREEYEKRKRNTEILVDRSELDIKVSIVHQIEAVQRCSVLHCFVC